MTLSMPVTAFIIVVTSFLTSVDCAEDRFGKGDLQAATGIIWKHLARLRGGQDDVEEVAMKLLARRRGTSSCVRHCQSVTEPTLCLALCILRATNAAHGPMVSVRRSATFLGDPSDCRDGLPCDSRVHVKDTADMMRASREDYDGWRHSLPPQVTQSKRGYNDVVDLCIAYNCPHVVPGSLDFMRCVQQFHCM